MKKIFFLTTIIFAVTAQAQFLKKLKEKAENAVGGKNTQTTNNTQHQNAVNTIQTTTTQPDYNYLNSAQAAEKFGKKIYVLPTSYVVRQGSTTGITVERVRYQYWTDSNEVKYYTEIGKVTGNVGYDAGAEILDMGVLKWNGSIISGTPESNKLPFSNSDLPPSINGYGTFEHERSAKNFLSLTEFSTTKYYTATATTGANYLPAYTISINGSGKKYGPYSGTPMLGMYVMASGDVYYATSASQALANEAYKNGKLLFDLTEPAAGGMNVKTSVNGSVALFVYMDMSKTGGSKPVWINKLGNGSVLPFTDNPIDSWVLMNSGELLQRAERSNPAFEEGKNIYLANGMSGSFKLSLPNGTAAFFSNETVKKWAVWEEGRQLFFSDGTAIAEQKKYSNGLPYNEECILNPKKLVINSKTYLVWLQVVNGTDIYLCKKEM